MLIAVHESQRIIWATKMEEHGPTMCSLAPDITIATAPDIPRALVPHMEGFNLVMANGGYGLHARPPGDLPLLRLARDRCRACWSLVRYLHQCRRSGMGYLPGHHIGRAGTPDGELSRQEQELTERLATQIEGWFLGRLWQVRSYSEMHQVTLEITMTVKRFQAYA
jgi:hypothetical protein